MKTILLSPYLSFLLLLVEQACTASITDEKNSKARDHRTAKGKDELYQEHQPVVNLLAPPMGFMSWERFRCTTDCTAYPHGCIDESLYISIADALVMDGYAAAGYRQVSIDDCWSSAAGRSNTTGELEADPDRFPNGIKFLADYMHAQNLLFGLYGDAGTETCAHYEGSQGYEDLDAATFARWGVDYIKWDGCYIDGKHHNHAPQKALEQSYTRFGNALRNASSARKMVYSCSWPAYTGTNDETKKPYQVMYEKAGCNTWRNYHDVDNRWSSVYEIVMHWADYWKPLQNIPEGAFNDADMLLVGDDHHGTIMLSLDQARLQMGFWAMIASALFIGADVRNITDEFRQILLNKQVIAVNQDVGRRQADCVMGCVGSPDYISRSSLILPDQQQQGIVKSRRRLSKKRSDDVQVWSKPLQLGESHVLAFFNLNSDNIASSIVYAYRLEGAVARCVDLWSDSPTQDICAKGNGNKTENWDIQLISDNNEHETFTLLIQALNVATTSHRMIQIDYFCGVSDTNLSSC